MSGEVRTALSALGLTDYEIRTYVSLLEQGPLTALNISSESGIPYSRVYDVLKTLEKKQFVTAGKGRPTIYVAKSPDEATRALILKQSKQITDAHIKCDIAGGGNIRGAHNCKTCDRKILDAIADFSLSQDTKVFNDLDCDCKQNWLDQLDIEDIGFGSLIDM